MIHVIVELLRPAFHGLGNAGAVDWPPSPVRLLGALKSGAHAITSTDTAAADPASAAHRALEKIAASPPPLIRTSAHRDLRIPDTFTEGTWVPDRLSGLGKTSPLGAASALSLGYFDMDVVTRVRKPQNAVALTGGRIIYEVDVELTDPELHALELATKNVAYFGRSNDPAILRVERAQEVHAAPDTHALPDEVIWITSAAPVGTTRGWTPDTIDWMDDNFERVFSSSPDIRNLPQLPAAHYTTALAYRDASATPESDADRLAVVRLDRSVAHFRIPQTMGLLRPLLAPNWRAIPLTVSAHNKADGRLVGFGITDAAHPDRAPDTADILYQVSDALARIASLDPRGKQVSSSGTLAPTSWIGPALRWRSTTPLRAFPDRRVLELEIARELEDAYGVEPLSIRFESAPTFAGQHRWSSSSHSDGFAQWWVEIMLSSALTGPLVLGASKLEGFGVLRPIFSEGKS